VQIAIILLDF